MTSPFDPPLDAVARLLDQRRVFLRGPLDDGVATDAAAALMALDGDSERPVELVISSPGGSLDAVWPVLDVVAAMRAPVRTMALGEAGGTAAAVLACGTGGRAVAAHARLCLRLRDPVGAEAELRWARAEDLADAALRLAERRRQLALRLAVATGRRLDEVDTDLERGLPLTATQAVALGLADEVLPARSP